MTFGTGTAKASAWTSTAGSPSPPRSSPTTRPVHSSAFTLPADACDLPNSVRACLAFTALHCRSLQLGFAVRVAAVCMLNYCIRMVLLFIGHRPPKIWWSFASVRLSAVCIC